MLILCGIAFSLQTKNNTKVSSNVKSYNLKVKENIKNKKCHCELSSGDMNIILYIYIYIYIYRRLEFEIQTLVHLFKSLGFYPLNYLTMKRKQDINF
jgi:hypothetical protein